MAPKKRRQRAGMFNYLKHKDVVRSVGSDGGAGVNHAGLETEEQVVREVRDDAIASGGREEGRLGT